MNCKGRRERRGREEREEKELATENLVLDKCADRYCILASQC
ncbi:hypothetical protein [Microcoleus sp. MOSTC5]